MSVKKSSLCWTWLIILIVIFLLNDSPIEKVIFFIIGIIIGIGSLIIGANIHDYLIRKGFNLSFKYDYIILNDKVPSLKEAKGLVKKINPYLTAIEIIGSVRVNIENDMFVLSKDENYENETPLIRFKKKKNHRIIPLKIGENKFGIYLRQEA
jgi:hypothetical protein